VCRYKGISVSVLLKGRRAVRARVQVHPLLSFAFAAMVLTCAFELLRAATGVGGPALDSLTNNWVYMAVEFVAIGVCVAKASQHGQQRRAWALMALALAFWSVGDLLWAVWLDGVSSPPFPSPADLAYLLMYPTMYASLMLLIRSRLRSAGASQWLDGGVVALAVGSVAAALVFSDVIGATHGQFVADAVTIAYPVGDFILLMFVALAYTLADWRPGRAWLALGAGVALMAVGDIMNVDHVAGGIYVDDTLLNAIYLISFSLLAAAAWVPSDRGAKPVQEAPHTIALTTFAAAVALGLLVCAAFMTVTPLAVGLAAGSLILAAVRSALTYLENVRMLRAKSTEALTDALTGLGNRRQLIADLDDALDASALKQPRTLAFFDLNGFKRYNDTFGHLAGDALLTRLGSALKTVVADNGRVYRLGGDEFCVLLDDRYAPHDSVIAAATSALTEHGQGFTVTVAAGTATIPDEASTATAALRLADQRMYADKGRANRTPTRDVLLQLLTECTPDLVDHLTGVTVLTAGVAAQMGLDAEQTDEVLRAAELHDIGKLAIPDEILNKPGPLDTAEREFMQQHPVIGQRILSAAPALTPVGAIVRASHERWDGHGYPDGLAGHDIPIGARIVAVCDAYDAIITHRCYQRARHRSDALIELARNTGTQFDPSVIAALGRHLSGTTHSRATGLGSGV
jgi:two-component system cell cycle response regulator